MTLVVAVAAASILLTQVPLIWRATASRPATSSSRHGALPRGLASAVRHTLGGDGLVEAFEADGGLHVREASASAVSWSLVPEGLERGRASAAFHRAPPTRAAGEADYDLGPLQASYRPSAAGIEQAFVVTARVPGPGSLSLDLSSSGSLRPRSAGPGALDLLDRSGRHVLSYSGLRVADATGRLLGARLQTDGTMVHLVVDDRDAAYPLRIDPWVQQAELASSGGAAGDAFGFVVALSGTTALVGAPAHQVGPNVQQGTAYVFSETGGSWTEQAALTSADGKAGDFFGTSVALSGTTALVGSPFHQVGASADHGAAYVFTQNGGTWSQQAELTTSDQAANDAVGSSVALSGTTALVGASGQTIGSNLSQGAAYVFTESGGAWTQQAMLTASDGRLNDVFGNAVALSGTTALVAAEGHAVGANTGQGVAYIFTGSGNTWSQQAELTSSDGGAGDFFGNSVALSGSTALVGAPFHQVGSNASQGAAYVFTGSGSTWSQQAELTANDGAANDDFGPSVALSGSTALVGAPFHQVGSNAGQGAAYVFTENGGTWGQQAQLAPADGRANDSFANSVALSGSTALVGSPFHQVGSNAGQGTAYVFQAIPLPSVTSVTPRAGPPGGGTSVVVDGTNLAGTTSVHFGSNPGTDVTVDPSGESLTVTAPAGSGTVDVTVTTPGGTSTASPSDQFTYATVGYDMVGSDGGVFVFPEGQPSGFFGSLPGLGIHVSNIVGMDPTLDHQGYLVVGSDGGVFAFGDAAFLGSLPALGLPVNNIVGLVRTAQDRGYFLVGSDGGVFSFGDAPFLGSLPGLGIDRGDIVGIAATPSGNGYWVVAADGTVYAFGAARVLGSATGTASPVSAIAGTADGGGYWITTQSGVVLTYGDAGNFSDLANLGVAPASPVIGLVPTSDGGGYLLVGADGGLFAFGDVSFAGSLPGLGVEVDDIVGAVPTG